MTGFTHLRRRAILPLPIEADRGPPDPDVVDPFDVQGDIYVGFPKQSERFIFFSITNVPQFKAALKDFKPTSAAGVDSILRDIDAAKAEAEKENREVIPVDKPLFQIAFTRFGLNRLNFAQPILDDRFDSNPMRHDKDELGDMRTWEPVFDEPGNVNLHGIILLAAGTVQLGEAADRMIVDLFGPSLTVLHREVGHMLPDRIEHFGYRDGVSQPSLRDLTVEFEGQTVVDPGVIVMGFPGDPKREDRPEWTKGGSLLVFRKLEQDVKEFNDYLMSRGQSLTQAQLGPGGDSLLPDQKAELFGARLVGRWKSGAPIYVPSAQFADDTELAADLHRNNNFNYLQADDIAGITPAETTCPFFSHIRKIAPRNPDPTGRVSQAQLEAACIIRTGIPYGKLWTEETKNEKRGLLFVCYQSVLNNGFVNITVNFANQPDFPPTDPQNPHKYIAQDPIVGGPDPNWPETNGPEPDYFVTSKGGEYFFVPPISALQTLAQ